MDAPHDNFSPHKEFQVCMSNYPSPSDKTIMASNSSGASEEMVPLSPPLSQKEMITSVIDEIQEELSPRVHASAPQSPRKSISMANDPVLAGVSHRKEQREIFKLQSESNVIDNQNSNVGGLDESMNTTPVRASRQQVPPAMLMSKQMSLNRKHKGIRKKARNPEKAKRPSFIATNGEQPSDLMNESFTNWESPEAAMHNLAIQENSKPEKHADREYVSIHDDVYNLFFLSRVGGHAFWYSLYVFGLKMALYTFLAIDAFQNESLDQKTGLRVLMAQFLMLPVAVAMQDDLIATYYLIANIKYCPSIRRTNPEAYEWKFNIATACRAIDGAYSLCVNFVVLVSATDVLSLFLNFAALQFLQTIDNIALELAADGYLTDRLEDVAGNVKEAELPKRSDENWLRCVDTILFVTTCVILFAFWLMFIIHIQVEPE